MLDILAGLKRIVKTSPVSIDNAVFRLHWLLTSIMLIAFSSIITARQYVGQPIDCLQLDDIPETILNTFCWIHSTYTIPDAFRKKIGVQVPYPGIENTRSYGRSETNRKYYTYYQWICFLLFLQGIFFYVPYYFWKLWEGGLLRAITMGMNIAIISDEERGHKKKIILDYLYKHMKTHRLYAFKYFFCELLCLINIILQIYLTDRMLGGDGAFLYYGLDVLFYINAEPVAAEQMINPFLFLFPRMTKCEFRSYGSSGDIQRYDALCLLPINVFNEKIYLFLWFWFMILALFTTVVLLYRVFIFFFPMLRPKFLQSRCRLSNYNDLKQVCRHGNIGDFFLLYMMGKNLDPIIMREITEKLARKLEAKQASAQMMNLSERINML